MKLMDPIFETAIGSHSRLNRALVFLDRAAWLLTEAQNTIGFTGDLEEIHTAVDILRGATAQAAHDLAVYVCAVNRPRECPSARAPCDAARDRPDRCGDCEWAPCPGNGAAIPAAPESEAK